MKHSCSSPREPSTLLHDYRPAEATIDFFTVSRDATARRSSRPPCFLPLVMLALRAPVKICTTFCPFLEQDLDRHKFWRIRMVRFQVFGCRLPPRTGTDPATQPSGPSAAAVHADLPMERVHPLGGRKTCHPEIIVASHLFFAFPKPYLSIQTLCHLLLPG